ncbi:MAG TPA: hypothetical protein GX396_03980 [Tissierellia bacterium]|nr:hypothetical protein [Tissierellia bacterium]
MNNKSYRVMKFLEPVNKKDKCRGYVRLNIRGVRGNLIVAAENLGDAKSFSEVYLYKDRQNKIKLGNINNKKGMLKKVLTFGNANAIEDYNICAVVQDGKIVLFSNLFNPTSLDIVRKLEEDQAEEEMDVQVKAEQRIEKSEVKEEKEEIVNTVKEEPKREAEIKEEAKESVEGEETVTVSKEEFEEPSVEGTASGYRKRQIESIYNTLKNYRVVEPLSVKLKDFTWWYIPYDEKGTRAGTLPYYNQIISSYYPYPVSNRVTTCTSLMKKYGHYIFGIYKENDEIVKYIYGVPGEFTKEEQPYRGVTGFKNWSYGNRENKGYNGYWLAFVNPKTGETTEPPQVSIT